MQKNIRLTEFSFIWFEKQGLNIPKHQKLMTEWLDKVWSDKDKRQGLLMSFRNSGKSTIVGLFCAWALYQDSATRILVLAADYSLAKKMVRNVKRIIEQHPLTQGMKPAKIDQWAADQFTINRDMEFRDPSMLAKGLQANITGLRADLIICDDVEVPKNCDTSLKREDMREKLQELDYILTPNGMQLYIGTPHTYYTIYQTEFDENKKEVEPFLLNFEKLKIPILNKKGDSAWPERFTKEKIASIRARSGESKFQSQMMLEPVNLGDSVLDPSLLNRYNEEINVTYSQNKEVLKIGEKKMISASCWWDPSFALEGKNGDNSVIACVFTDEEGQYWLHDIEYIKVKNGNIAVNQCEKVARFLEKNCLSMIRVEANGIGKFLPSILRQTLQDNKQKIAVMEMFSKDKKEKRILEAFDVLLAARALNVHAKVWQTQFIMEMREWSYEGNQNDDGLDAVAGCLLSEPVRLFTPIINKNDFKRSSWQHNADQFQAKFDFKL